jgi:hypothetical protein
VQPSSANMLPPPASLYGAYTLGLMFCLGIGGTFSVPAVWAYFFKNDKDGVPVGGAYLKAGEYGETEIQSGWSVFKEPLNAWTSLAYTLYGFVICYVAYEDFSNGSIGAENNITSEPMFSLLIGATCMYLGISSFLFHASHTETWRKADAGMTSGICIPLVIFAIWDRTRLHGVGNLAMVAIGVFLLFSLTHGYVPYGSSDILLPAMIIVVWSLELVPRYGGPMHDEEYVYWIRCLFAVVGGALLRAIDVKRKVFSTKTLLIAAYFLFVAIFGVLVGFTDDSTICAIVAGALVAIYPARGHVFWHIASAYALYIWWYALRMRPGNPATAYHSDSIFVNFLLFVAVKNGFRRLIMNLPSSILPTHYQDRARLFAEHLLFSIWGVVTVVEIPGPFHSWFFQPILCWYKPGFPNRAFLVYYTAKVATHAEDALFLWITGKTYTQRGGYPSTQALNGALLPFHTGQVTSTTPHKGSNDEADPHREAATLSAMSSRSERADGERMRGFHHNIAALMAVVSLFAGERSSDCVVFLCALEARRIACVTRSNMSSLFTNLSALAGSPLANC